MAHDTRWIRCGHMTQKELKNGKGYTAGGCAPGHTLVPSRDSPGLTWGPENGSGNEVPKNKPKVTLYFLGN